MKSLLKSSKTLSAGNVTALLPLIDRMLSHQSTGSKLKSDHRLEMSKLESHHHLSLAEFDAKLQIGLAELSNIDRENMRQHQNQGKILDILEKVVDSNDVNVLQKMQLVGSVFLQSTFNKNQKTNLIEMQND